MFKRKGVKAIKINGFSLPGVVRCVSLFSPRYDCTAFLAAGLSHVLPYHLTNYHHLGLRAGILNWHFIDVVELFLFVSTY